MCRFLTLVAVLLLAVPALSAQDQTPPISSSVETVKASEVLTYTDAVILGAVEGFTEYLPISSTGHLILTNELLGLNNNRAVINGDGVPIRSVDGELMTVQDTADAYAIIIQAGAIAAVILIYWKRILEVLQGFLGRNRKGLLLGRNLIVAFLPAAVLGFLFNDLITRYLFGTVPVAIALLAGAILMLWAEWWRKRHDGKMTEGLDLHDLRIGQCLFIGLMQSLAMWPGASRSMMTIVGGYLTGLSAPRAAEFSFLLGLITLTAAAGYTLLKHGEPLMRTLDAGPALLGILVATITAAVAVKWLVAYLSRHGLGFFAWYRIALAILVLAFV